MKERTNFGKVLNIKQVKDFELELREAFKKGHQLERDEIKKKIFNWYKSKKWFNRNITPKELQELLNSLGNHSQTESSEELEKLPSKFDGSPTGEK
jgi:hypothetical protein